MSKTVVLDPKAAYSPQLLPVPPLESGDRLSRAEFERRYKAMPHINKAELIEGVVYMPSPVHFASHGQPHAHVITWLGTYCAATPGVQLADNATMLLDVDNEVQPDALLRLEESKGGQSRINHKDYVAGASELVVEIAASSASIDLHGKKHVYRRTGIKEYLVWQIYDGRITWFVLDEGEYQELTADEQGIICSRVFPGLWLTIEGMLSGDLTAVLSMVQQGIETTEHATYSTQLENA